MLSRLSATSQTAGNAIADAVKGGKLKLSDISGITTIKDGNIGIDKNFAGRRADQVAGQNISGIFGTNPNLRTKALSNILGLTGNSRAQYITDQTGGIMKILDGADTSRASGLTKAISMLFKDTALGSYIDDNAVLGTAMAYLEEAIALGVPTLIDSIMGKVNADKDAKKRLIDNTLLIVARGDLATLNKIMDWIGPEGVLIKVPQAVKILLGAYKLPFRSEPGKYQEYREELIGTLNRLKPEWHLTTMGTERVYDFDVFSRVSAHSKLLLLLNDDPTYLVPVLAAPKYKMVDLIDLARRNYPLMAVWR